MSFKNSISLLQKWLNDFHFSIFIPSTVCRMMHTFAKHAPTEEHNMSQLFTLSALAACPLQTGWSSWSCCANLCFQEVPIALASQDSPIAATAAYHLDEMGRL